MTPTDAAALRPRVEGDREQEILDAALEVLAEVGYDRFTMDAVAQRAKASKATLYRRWTSKVALIMDAFTSYKQVPEVPDTGNLRDDLIGTFCGLGGLTDLHSMSMLGAVLTALGTDAEFAESFRERVVGPKKELSRQIYRRARDRGEVREDLDLDLIEPALAGIVLHRLFMLGETPDVDLITRVVDQIILPAVRPHHS